MLACVNKYMHTYMLDLPKATGSQVLTGGEAVRSGYPRSWAMGDSRALGNKHYGLLDGRKVRGHRVILWESGERLISQ